MLSLLKLVVKFEIKSEKHTKAISYFLENVGISMRLEMNGTKLN